MDTSRARVDVHGGRLRAMHAPAAAGRARGSASPLQTGHMGGSTPSPPRTDRKQKTDACDERWAVRRGVQGAMRAGAAWVR